MGLLLYLRRMPQLLWMQLRLVRNAEEMISLIVEPLIRIPHVPCSSRQVLAAQLRFHADAVGVGMLNTLVTGAQQEKPDVASAGRLDALPLFVTPQISAQDA